MTPRTTLAMPLMLTAATTIGLTTANADLTGLSTTSEAIDQSSWTGSDPRDLYLVSVYAEFDDADDRVIAIYGSNSNATDLSVTTDDASGFWQYDQAGGASPGDFNTSVDITAVHALNPSSAFDSFLTIGLQNETDNQLQEIGIASLSEWDSFNDGSGSLTVTNGAIFVTPDDTQGDAGAEGKVLIGQFAVGDGTHLDATFNIQYRDNANETQYGTGLSVSVNVGGGPSKHDMTGDGIADVLWRNSNGNGSKIYAWMVDASDPSDLTYSGDFLLNSASALNSWQIAGNADHDGDGQADILWRDPNNRMFVWKVRYDASNASDPLTYDGDWLYTGTGLAGWSVDSVVDMTGDGIADVLWRNSNGNGSKIFGWIVDASDPSDLTYTGDYIYEGTTQLNSWQISGTGDFDGDGIADILWRDPNNRMYVWKVRYDGSSADELTYDGDWLYTGTGLAGWSVENDD
jgi:hypothetical protein